MQRIGPALETLTRRLAETPPDFLDEPASDPAAATVEAALVNDLLGALGARATAVQLAHFHRSADKSQRNRLTLVRIAVWLLYDPWFMTQQLLPDVVFRLLDETVAELAASSAADSFAFDSDRREELARVVLARLDYRPAHETLAQATDRLSGISGTERRRLLEASREAERRARAIREALVKKAAEESADKWTRE